MFLSFTTDEVESNSKTLLCDVSFDTLIRFLDILGECMALLSIIVLPFAANTLEVPIVILAKFEDL